MKRILMSVLFSLILLLNYSLSPAGVHDSLGKKINIHVPFRLQIYEDGKATDKFIVGSLQIFDFNDTLHISWNDVLISPLHSQKIVLLKAETYDSKNDIFENIVIKDDRFSFTMVLPPFANRIEISGYKKTGAMWHTLKCERVFKGLEAGDKPGHVEWRPVQRVILPYREVY
jgi:hypothetical protein